MIRQHTGKLRAGRFGRRLVAALFSVILGTTGLGAPQASAAGLQPGGTSAEAAKIDQIVDDAMTNAGVRAAIVKVTRGDEVVIRKAYGPSMTGVPATPEMHFRNGAVAFAYLGTLLMKFVDQEKAALDSTIDKWMPDLPNADKVTLRMLANQTSGYPDYVADQRFLSAFMADPFHISTYEERLGIAFSRSVQFEPGSNWGYSHTNFMILGEILAKIGGKPLEVLLREEVYLPMGLKSTAATRTSAIPSPALHTFSAERVPPNYEEATFWNTQWGTPVGANATTTIDDLITTAVSVGTGKLLSRSSYREMTDPKLLGFGQRAPGCHACFPQTINYNFGLGIVRRGDWIVQNPLLSGIGVIEAYLPAEKVAIAIAATLKPEAFEADGSYSNPADPMFEKISAVMAPDHAAPTRPR